MAMKQYVDPKTGAMTTTSQKPPEGYKAYDPSMGTSLASIRQATGYNDSLQKGLEQQQKNQLQSNIQAAKRIGYSTSQIGDFMKGTSDPATTKPINTALLNLPQAQAEPTRLSLQEQIAEKAKQAKVANFKQQLEEGTASLQAEAESLTPRFLEARRGVETGARMRETAAQKAAQVGGLGQAGSLPQTQIASNVMRQGAVSRLTEQEQALRADIDRRLTQLQQAVQAGIAGADTEAEIARLTAQLGEFDRREAEVDKALQTELATIGRYYNDIQAEIDRRKATADTSDDALIPYLEQMRVQKTQEQGLDPTTGQPLQTGVTFTVPQALEATRQGFWNEAIASALGLPFTEQGRMQATGGGVGGGVTPTTTTNQAEFIDNTRKLLIALRAPAGVVDGVQQYADVSPEVAIQKIRQNYDAYVSEYGQDVVDSLVSNIANQMQGVAPEDYLKQLETEQGILEAQQAIQGIGVTEAAEIPRDVLNTLEAQYVRTDEMGNRKVDKEAMFNAVFNLVLNGNLTKEQGERIESLYGLGDEPATFSGTATTPSGLSPILVRP